MVLVMIVWRSIVFVTGCDIAGTGYVGCVVWLPGAIGWAWLVCCCLLVAWVRGCVFVCG